MQYLTVQIVLTERKASLITVFPQIVKNTGKTGLKLAKVRREEKCLAQIFRKDLTETKLERTRTRIRMMLSASPSSLFLHKVHNIRYEKQIHILS